MFWKRAQILVAETWAALYPPTSSKDPSIKHPLLPHGVSDLTMFADYRVPQILHHLRIITYPPHLVNLLKSKAYFAPGSREELSIRAASILAVEAIREEMLSLGGKDSNRDQISSVIIDFYLWDLAKRIEDSHESLEGIKTVEILPAHRTRSIWY